MANENDNDNGGKPQEPTTPEPVYVMAPHPEAHVISNEKTEAPEEPAAAEKSMSDMIQEAVDGLRAELMEELQTQADRIQAELQQELKGETHVTG